MEIRLDMELPKVTDESERSVSPSETIESAMEGLGRIGIKPECDLWDRDGFVWVASLTGDFLSHLPSIARGMRVAGKGPSREQCLASCYMELVERASLFRYAQKNRREHDCLDLRDGRMYKIGNSSDMVDTVSVASGNNHEEALLHALHELVEKRLMGSCIWKPFKLVDLDALDMEFPRWVKESFVAIQTPSDIPELFHATVIRYPADGKFDLVKSDRIIRVADRLFMSSGGRPLNHHSPHSGGAAGLNPTACVFRGIGEILQGDRHAPDGGARRAQPEHIQVAGAGDLVNRETPCVTGDIRKIMDLLSDEVFLGVIDMTDPEIGIPVVKLISDWNPHRSLVSRETMGLFFESDEDR